MCYGTEISPMRGISRLKTLFFVFAKVEKGENNEKIVFENHVFYPRKHVGILHLMFLIVCRSFLSFVGRKGWKKRKKKL